jgi:ComF family protein
MRIIANILNHFFELFFPCLCVCCGKRLVRGERHLCVTCLSGLPVTRHLREEHNELENFFAGRFRFHQAASFAYFVKGGNIQKIIHEFKYRNNPGLAYYIGTLCGKEIINHNSFETVDFIVPIPLHRKRLRKRGYNQSLLVAQGISQLTGKPVNTDNLIRKINNPSQTKNSRFERWRNTEGIFDIINQSVFENKHILLIDDVVTTGSTLEVCAKLILECKQAQVSIYTVGVAV